MVSVPIVVRCPRCAEKIDLTIEWRVLLTQRQMGRKAFITAETAANGIEHTCPDGGS